MFLQNMKTFAPKLTQNQNKYAISIHKCHRYVTCSSTVLPCETSCLHPRFTGFTRFMQCFSGKGNGKTLTDTMAGSVKLGEPSVKPQGSHGGTMNQALTHW